MTILSPERMWDIPRVGAPHALSDGRLMVPVTTYDAATDEATTDLWRLDPAHGRRLFASGQISGVAVPADGGSIAYLKKVGDHKQVHIQPTDGGEGRRVADLPLGAVGVKWMPDGRLIALASLWMDHPDLEATGQHEPDPHVTARATEAAVYQHWDIWLEQVYHPIIIDPETQETFDLTPGWTRFWAWPSTGEPIDDLDMSPDGSTVAFSVDDSKPPHRELSWSLFLVGTDGRGLRRIDEERTGHSRRPRFTPDGSALVFGYQEQPEYYACPVQLVRHDLSSGEEQALAPDWDRSPSGWEFGADGQLFFVAEDEGRSRLWRLSGDKPQPLTTDGWVSDPTLAPDGQIHVLAHSLTSPPEIHRVDGEGGTQPVSEFTSGALGEVALGTVREVTFTGGAGDPIQMWLIDPPGADPGAPLPLVHLIHGGPHGVFGDAWHWRWNAQAVAAAGYRVATVNFHGSTGWGDAFARSIHGAWGDLPYQDVEASTDHLVAEGLADPERMAVTGGSYGGYLAAWITSQTDRYTCAIAHAAVTNLGGMYASDITYGRLLSYGAEIWEDREAVDRWSPSAHSSGYATPTLVVHGHRDRRVPLTQGQELYGVLVARGVPARLVAYPDQDHWIRSRANSIHWYREFLGWLERWL